MRPATEVNIGSATEVLVADQGTTRTVTPRGEIDLASVPLIQEPLARALSDGVATVVLDLGETTFLDSTGVHLVLDAKARALVSDVHFVILPGPANVQRTFELCGVVHLLPFAPQQQTMPRRN